MKDEGDVVRDFFKDMRESDTNVSIPPFANPRREKMPFSYILIAVAASLNIILFLGAVWGTIGSEKTTPAAETSTNQAKDTDELMKWETPTDQLLSQF